MMVWYRYFLLSFWVVGSAFAEPATEQLQKEIQVLQRAIEQHQNQTPYIVIDTVHNRLQMRHGSRVLREAICATGSGKVLLNPDQTDRWQFITPRGIWQVRHKVTDPIWAKPLWAFVETGESAPVLPWEFRRLDRTTLGAFALKLGDGYEIHGTLYPTLLGRHITHGCVRLNDEDLAFIYHHSRVGQKVYIY